MIEITKESLDGTKLKLVTSSHIFMPCMNGVFKAQVKVNGETYYLKARPSKENKTLEEDIGENIHIWDLYVVKRLSFLISYNNWRSQVFISITRTGDAMTLTVEEWEAA